MAQRKKARDQQVIKRFLTLTPLAADYYQALADKRLNPLVHVRKIVALSEIYSPEEVRRAMEDASEFQAFSAEYITNILEQRARPPEKLGALKLTRREDLLDLDVESPDMSIYKSGQEDDS